MKTTVTATKQWQIYIPESIRQALGLKNQTRFNVEVKDKQLVLTPEKSSLLKHGGSLKKYAKNAKDIDIDNIRDYIDYSDL